MLPTHEFERLDGLDALAAATGFKATDVFPATWFVESSTIGMH